MENKSENFFIGIIISILTTLFFFIISFVKKEIIINPYSVSIAIVVIFILFFIYLRRSIKDTNELIWSQGEEIKELRDKLNFFIKTTEEKLKIDHRLNKLEGKMFDGKK